LGDVEIDKMIRTAVVVNPVPANWKSLAKFYRSRLMLAAAKKTFEQGIQAAKESPEKIKLLFDYSLLLYLIGDYNQARQLYELRLEQADLSQYSLKILPQWQGEDLPGKTLMIYAEQGMGDKIQFARFVPLVKKIYGGRIVLVVQKPLMPLFRQLEDVDEVLEFRAGIRPRDICRHDYAAAIMSLPFKMNLSFEDYPAAPYLAAKRNFAGLISTRIWQAMILGRIPSTKLLCLKTSMTPPHWQTFVI
jgi:hypothetical protein